MQPNYFWVCRALPIAVTTVSAFAFTGEPAERDGKWNDGWMDGADTDKWTGFACSLKLIHESSCVLI